MSFRMRAVAAPLAFVGLAAACGGGEVSTPSPAAAPIESSLSSESLLLDLPIAPGDSVSIGYGIWPYGVHGSAHALDGHPGFDFEYRPRRARDSRGGRHRRQSNS